MVAQSLGGVRPLDHGGDLSRRNPATPMCRGEGPLRHSRRGGQLRGQAPAELRLLGAVPHPNVLPRNPQHPPSATRGLASCQGFSQLYDISYRGLILPRVSAGLGQLDRRRGAEFAAGGPRARDLGASRGLGRRRRRPKVGVRTALLLNRGPGALVGSGAGGIATPSFRWPRFYRSLSKHSCRSIGLAIQRQRWRSRSRHLSPCRSSHPPP
jgi:hypothetical protein